MKRTLGALRILAVLVIAAPALATTFFDESFETAVVPLDPNTPHNPNENWFLRRSWGGSDSTGIAFRPPPTTVVFPGTGYDNCYFTTERAHSGSVSFKADYHNCCDTSENPMTAPECSLWTGAPLLPGNLQEAWVRYWRYGVNYDIRSGGNSNKNVYLYTNGKGYPNFIMADFGLTGITTGLAPNNSRDCFSPNDPWPSGFGYTADCNTSYYAFPNQGVLPGANDAWQCMESHIKLNTYDSGTGVPDRNGLLESYVNGQLVLRAQDIALQPYGGGGNTQGISLFQNLIFYRQGALTGSVLYYDDVAVATERIGCGSTPTDTIPPANPRGLRIQ